MIKTILQRLLVYMSIGVIILLFIWDFSEERSPADGKISVRYWFITGQKEEIPYIAKKFNMVQDTIVVQATAIPWQEHEKKILTAVLSGNPPDVVSQFIPVVKWASRMALMPLDGFIQRDNFDSSIFFSALWEEMQWQDHIFALPVSTASYAFFYNKRLFQDAGLDPERPPRTWDEVREYAKRLTKRDRKGRFLQMGFLPNYGNLQTAVLMAWQLGASFLSENGTEVTLTNPEMLKALQWVVDFFNDYPLDEVSAFMAGFGYADQHGFIAEKVAMMVLDSSFPYHIASYRPDLEYGVATVPTFVGCPTASSSGSWWMAIPRGAKHPEAAWEFMKFAVDAQIQLESVANMEEPLFPANRLAAVDPSFIKDKATAIFVEQMNFAHSPTIVPMAHDIFWRELQGAQERAIHRIQTPIESLRQAEQVVQRELERARAYDRYVRTKVDFWGTY